MPDWKIRRAPTIQTELEVPGDKSISHRAVMLASMANGTCVIRGFLPSEDCLCTVAAMRALGIQIENADETTLIIHGKRRTLPRRSRISIAAIPEPPCASWPVSWPGSPFAVG
jgi:5-enolpyruvylshikimate-3-phosphate synthase